jgi:hypothetical protein
MGWERSYDGEKGTLKRNMLAKLLGQSQLSGSQSKGYDNIKMVPIR